ncbi:hypothetical protein Tco_0785752, partial [Tanacetum coccineum]
MGNEELSTIPEKESDEFIKSSVEDLIPIPESKDSYVSNLDESALLLTPLFDANKDESFDPGGVINEIDIFFLDMDISMDIENGYHDSEGDIIYLESLLIDDTSPNLPPEVFLDHDPRSLKDELDNDDLMTEDKVFDLGITEKIFSPTYVRLSFEDRHYLSFTYVLRVFLPYFTYSVDSPFLLSSGSEDTIFDPDISTFHFSSLKPVAYENPIVLENIESKDSYVSNLDEPALLVTPLSDANEDECFDPGGEINEIDAFLDMDISTDIENGYHDSEGYIIYLESLLINDTIPNLPPEVFLDNDPKNLKDEPDNEDLKSMVKVFDPDIHEK